MLIQRKNPNDILRGLNAIAPLFQPNVPSEVQKIAIQPTLDLADQITRYAPEFLTLDRPITVYIMEADTQELILNGANYELLNTLFGTSLNWDIHLLTSNHNLAVTSYFDLHPKHKDSRVSVMNRETDIHSYIVKNGLPDLIVANSISFEERALEVEANKLAQYLQKGVKIVGGSHGSINYQYEMSALACFNIKLTNVIPNRHAIPPLKDDDSKERKEFLKTTACMTWNNAIWTLQYSDELKDLNLNEVGFQAFLQAHFKLCLHPDTPITGGRIGELGFMQIDLNSKLNDPNKLFLSEHIYLNHTDNSLYCTLSATPLIDNVNIEIDDAHINKHIHAHKALLRTLIHIKYDEELETAIQGQPWATQYEDEIFKSRVSPLSGNAELQQKIHALIDEKNHEAIRALPKGELANFRDRDNCNLAQVATLHDDVELLKIAIANGSNLGHYDDDGFNILDCCVEVDAMDCAEYLLTNTSIKHLLNTIGSLTMRTPLHTCALRGSTNMYQLFLKHGANEYLEDGLGRTSRSILNG